MARINLTPEQVRFLIVRLNQWDEYPPEQNLGYESDVDKETLSDPRVYVAKGKVWRDMRDLDEIALGRDLMKRLYGALPTSLTCPNCNTHLTLTRNTTFTVCQCGTRLKVTNKPKED